MGASGTDSPQLPDIQVGGLGVNRLLLVKPKDLSFTQIGLITLYTITMK